MATGTIPNNVHPITSSELGISVVNSIFANGSYADGNSVNLCFEIPAWHPSSANVNTPIGTIDSKFRPSANVALFGYSTNGSYGNVQPISGMVLTDGTIRILANETSNSYYFIFANYVR